MGIKTIKLTDEVIVIADTGDDIIVTDKKDQEFSFTDRVQMVKWLTIQYNLTKEERKCLLNS